MKKNLLLIAIIFFISGCGPSQKDFDKASLRVVELETLVSKLQAELDDEKFGSNRLLNLAKAAIDSKNNDEAKKILEDLLSRHPAALEVGEAKSLLVQVNSRIAAAELAQKKAEEQKVLEAKLALEKAIGNMKKDTDEIRGITWVKHRNTPVLGTYVSLYFGTKDGSAATYPLRFKIQYQSDDWLFINSIIVKADDKTYTFKNLDFERDHSSGSIWEWTDFQLEDHKMFKQWMSAKKVVFRFEGRTYYKDFILPRNQNERLREVYKAWEVMGGKIN